MHIAVFGAGGAIGQATIPELLGRGHTVRAVGRRPAMLDRFAADGVERFAADLSDPAQARSAAEGVDAILYAVGLPYPDFRHYPGLARTAVTAARAARVKQLLLISTVYPYGTARQATVSETHPREPHTRKGQARKEQADIVLGAHAPDGLQTAVLVLPDFYGAVAAASYATEIFEAARTGRVGMVVGPLDVPHEFVYAPDVAPVIADLFARPAAFGRTYHLGGAGTITTRDFIRLAEDAAGRRIRHLAANRTLLRLAGTMSPLMREMVEMYYLFTDPVVLDDRLLRSVLPEVRKTPYADGIAATLRERAGRHAVHA